jgi:hypothetical protein
VQARLSSEASLFPPEPKEDFCFLLFRPLSSQYDPLVHFQTIAVTIHLLLACLNTLSLPAVSSFFRSHLPSLSSSLALVFLSLVLFPRNHPPPSQSSSSPAIALFTRSRPPPSSSSSLGFILARLTSTCDSIPCFSTSLEHYVCG